MGKNKVHKVCRMSKENGTGRRRGAYRAAVLLFLVAVLALSAWPVAAKTASTSKQVKARAEKIVKGQVKKKDSGKKKLKKLFAYVEKTYGYKRTVGFKSKKGWEKTYALEMFREKKGSCYHFAAAYAFLAKAATGYKVRIGLGKTNGFSGKLQPHAWVEIRIGSRWYISDPNMDKFAENSSGKYGLEERSKLKKTYNKFRSVKYVTVAF